MNIYRASQKKTVAVLVLLAVSLGRALCRNYILNGGFEEPSIKPRITLSSPHLPPQETFHWYGLYEILGPQYYVNLGTGQVVELTPVITGTLIQILGFVEQKVNLEEDGQYIISYTWGLIHVGNPASYFELTAYWNGEPVDILKPGQTNQILVKSFQVSGKKGINLLRIAETMPNAYDPSFHGFCVDEVTMEKLPQDKFKKQPLRAIIILPRNMKGLKSFMFVMDELWLYIYDKQQHSALVDDIFLTIQEAERFRWGFFDYHSIFRHINKRLPLSDYSQFSNKQFMKVESYDGSFIRSTITFLVLTLPQMGLFCLIMNKVFDIIREYRISILLRPYSFFPSFLEMTIEGNVGFFTYIFFNQMRMAFSFAYHDRLWLAFAVFSFFNVPIFVLSFYHFINLRYGKQAGYFIGNFYRTLPGLCFVTLRVLVRSCVQGAAHSLLHDNYDLMVVTLSCFEAVMLMLTLWAEYRYQVYITHTQCFLAAIYHLLMMLFNISLYIADDKDPQINNLAISMQATIIYALLVNVVAIILLDFTFKCWTTEEKRKKRMKIFLNLVTNDSQPVGNQKQKKKAKQRITKPAKKVQKFHSLNQKKPQNQQCEMQSQARPQLGAKGNITKFKIPPTLQADTKMYFDLLKHA